MTHFRQAAPDPEKASRDGVTNYIPARRQVNTDHRCTEPDCTRIAAWECMVEEVKEMLCDTCRGDAATTARNYQEMRIR